ncbi:MAG: cation:proton antiporter [Acidimicrobiia bacterium]|nr:cation:proton antiporter [Acidimicrobiia bacterium]
MEIAFIVVAFVLGFAAAEVRLPPLVGYLIAGFVLHAFGFESTETIDTIADLGVLLLLFGIGLKLKLSTLARPVVWAGASLHMAGTTAAIGTIFIVLGALGMPLASDLSAGQAMLIGFAFSFSSTVFAVKALEDRNEASSLAGRIAIGTLIVQDIFAVIFLTVAVDEPPSLWAIPMVIAVIAARPLYGWLLDRAGHGELLILLGLCLAVGVGAETFELVGLKADLGALIVGLTLANHRRAAELAERLLGFKDILLIGFFLSIGLDGAPGGAELLVAAVVLLAIPIKTAWYLFFMTRFRLRARTSWHASVTLANFSEFGLIVVAVGIDQGLLDQPWASVVAVAVAVSFALAAPVNTARYGLYARYSRQLVSLERHPIDRDDALIDPGDASILVFGMGRVGEGAYDELVRRRGRVVLGIDRDDEAVVAHEEAGREIVRGDALDTEFWDRISLDHRVDLVVLAMSDHEANLEAVGRIKEYAPNARIAAAAQFADERNQLNEAGVDTARNLYEEAGQGLADDACDLLEIIDADRQG